MQPTIELFLEQDWDDAEQARQKRDERLTELTSQGLECKAELLYNAVSGKRIYTINVLTPAQPESDRADSSKPIASNRPRRRTYPKQ